MINKSSDDVWVITPNGTKEYQIKSITFNNFHEKNSKCYNY